MNSRLFSWRRYLLLTLGSATLALVGAGCTHGRRSLDTIVEPDELVELLRSPRARVVLVDARAQDGYAAGHLEGAVHASPAIWKSETLARETGLSHEDLWQRRIGALGIDGRDPVVVYDDGRLTEAARVWFVLQHFGVENAAVLNGGFKALEPLTEAGNLRLSRDAVTPKAVAFKRRSGATGTIMLADRERVRQAVERGDAQLFDARTHAEYAGEASRPDESAGHLPDALSLPHSELLNEAGRLKSPEQLAGILESAGFQRDRPMITHCESGGRASLAALAAQRAGFGPVMNYYLSFGDWASDATCPVVKP